MALWGLGLDGLIFPLKMGHARKDFWLERTRAIRLPHPRSRPVGVILRYTILSIILAEPCTGFWGSRGGI